MRHEVAHAWDDVRNEKNPPNLRKLKGDALTDELIRLAKDAAPFESQSLQKLDPGKLSMQELLDRYQKVLPEKAMSFANPSTAEKHAGGNVMGFYAEGYSVFQGFCDLCKARLLRLLPNCTINWRRNPRLTGCPRRIAASSISFLTRLIPAPGY